MLAQIISTVTIGILATSVLVIYDRCSLPDSELKGKLIVSVVLGWVSIVIVVMLMAALTLTEIWGGKPTP